VALIHYYSAENLLPSKQRCVGEKLAIAAPNIVSTYEHHTSERRALLELPLYARLPLYCLDASLAQPYKQILNQGTERQDKHGYARPIARLHIIKDSCCEGEQRFASACRQYND
jgi:hypothetical protein